MIQKDLKAIKSASDKALDEILSKLQYLHIKKNRCKLI